MPTPIDVSIADAQLQGRRRGANARAASLLPAAPAGNTDRHHRVGCRVSVFFGGGGGGRTVVVIMRPRFDCVC
jgi:hypothetical protein